MQLLAKDILAIKWEFTYAKLWDSIILGNIWFWSIFHILLGLTCLITPYVLIAWFYTLLFSVFSANSKVRFNTLPFILGWLVPMELLGRMSKAYPFVPFEVGKYLGAVLLIYGIFNLKNSSRGSVGKWMLILSLPAVFLGFLYSDITYQDIVGNYLGIFNLSLAVIFFSNINLLKQELMWLFKVIFFPSLSILAYVLIRSPELDEVQFSLESNAALSGGFGANQVSTILGMAFGITLWLWIVKYDLFSVKWLNLLVPGAFLIWALLSFSRGGVIGAFLAVFAIILLIPGDRSPLSPRKINIPSILAIVLLIGGGFLYVNNLTDNFLLQRYQGETQGTLMGVKEKDFNQISTGRVDIFLNDIDMWLGNFVLGVGVGRSKWIRHEYGYPHVEAAHVEVSRLLSEHGLLGFIISILFLFTPVYIFFSVKGNHFKQAFILFCFILAISTTFHAAMRTFLSPFFYGLAFVKIKQLNMKSVNLSSLKKLPQKLANAITY